MKYLKISILAITCFMALIKNSYAYIDPISISSVLSLILAAIISAFYFIKMEILNFFSKINFIFKDINLLIKFLNKKKEIVFFYENNLYEYYLIEVAKQFEKNNNSKKLDVLVRYKYNERFIKKYDANFWVFHTNFFLYIALNTINCNLLVTTTPDLNISNFKKSKNCKCYFYVFHSLVSTQMIYKKDAFKNFDLIACATSFQKNEMVEEEEKFNLLKKEFFEAGYPFLTYLKKKNFLLTDDCILIAPTWNKNNINFYKDYYYELIDIILKNKKKIIFRPHPESLKRNKNIIFDLEDNFKKNENFKIDISKNFNKVFEAKYLITDWSGVAFEYAYILNRPLIFYDIEKKINNLLLENDLDVQNKMVEVKNRKDLGLIMKDPNQVFNIIEELDSNIMSFQESIKFFFSNSLYNEDDSDIKIYQKIIDKNNYLSNKSDLI